MSMITGSRGSPSVVFFFARSGDRRDLHSFPTRRSSDLESARCEPGDDSEARDSSPSAVSGRDRGLGHRLDRKSTRLNSSHSQISYAVFCLKKKKKRYSHHPTPATLPPASISTLAIARPH